MKKQTLLCIFIALSCFMKAQIPNPGFEQLSPGGLINNWGSSLLLGGYIDSLGVYHGDSIVYDNALYFSTNDAHSGIRAMELRNAYNYYSQQKIAGFAKVMSNDTTYEFFTSSVPIPFQQTPTHFTFYYKFFPVAQDTAMARMELYDSTATQVGEAEIEISAQAGSYMLASKPITYYGNGLPSFAAISFCTTKPGGVPNFGTRFLVDDVNLTVATGIKQQSASDAQLRFFPNPATDQLFIQSKNPHDKITALRITDANGRLLHSAQYSAAENSIQLDVKTLEKGIYFVSLVVNGQQHTIKFIK